MEEKSNEKVLNQLYNVSMYEIEFNQEKYEKNVQTLEEIDYNFETEDGE